MSSGYAPPPPPTPETSGRYGYLPVQPVGFSGPPRKRRTWLVVLSILAGIALLIVLFVAGVAAVVFA